MLLGAEKTIMKGETKLGDSLITLLVKICEYANKILK
jgi:hypothetical protein